MAEILLFFMIGVGISNIIVNASIFDSLRGIAVARLGLIGKLVSCMLCTGFWVGVVLWLTSPHLFQSYGLLAPICAGSSVSLACHIYDIITDCMIHYLEME